MNWPPRILDSAPVTMPRPAVMILAGPAGGSQQQPDEPAVEERRQPLGRVEEVERRPRRRRVHDDQVVGAVRLGVALELAQLLHRHVLLGTGERARQRDVERVLQDLLAPSPASPGSPRPRRRSASCRASSRRASPRAPPSPDAGDRTGGVVEGLDPHRLRQPARRVDGEDDDLAAALGGAQRQGRRRWWSCRRLPEPQHTMIPVARVVEQRVDVERCRRGRSERADQRVRRAGS